MTLHNAKGLEFRAVFLIGLEEGIFPHSRAVEEQGVEEERRLCYVGMTRARKRLTLSLARCRSLFGDLRFNLPSRFVLELPKETADGVAALDRLSPMQDRARKDVFYDDFDQRPRYGDAPLPARNKMRESRYDPASKPVMRQAAPGVGGLGPGARVKHPSFGVGTVEDSDGEGLNRKLVVRFGPGVGLKKVLARFIDPL